MRIYAPFLLSLLLAPPLFSSPPPTPAAPVRETTPQEAHAFLKATPKAQIIDVRTPQEFQAGHIKGAVCINVNSEDFKKEMARLDRTTPILIHCRSGSRSRRALAQIESLQFKQVLHLTDGFNAWVAADLPTEQSPSQKAPSK